MKNEEIEPRTGVSYLDHADRLDKMDADSDGYKNTAKYLTDMYANMISMEKIKNEAEAEAEKAYLERKALELKEKELELEEKKSKMDMVVRIVVPAVTVGISAVFAVLNASGTFVDSPRNWILKSKI